MMSDLPRDLAEEILSKTPLTSTRAVRSTCKKWNTLSKGRNFTKKQLGRAAKEREREGEFLAIVVMNFGLYLTSINLHRGIQNNSDPSVKPEGKLISLDSDKIEISRVCHCEGLLLCTTVDYTRLVVWNPYTGQTRWICVEPRSVKYNLRWYGHGLGYDKSQSHKILRFHCRSQNPVHEIYELNSNSWRVLDVTPDWKIDAESYGLNLKGNTYWFAYDREADLEGDRRDVPDFLLCFDFETERFGPRLHLPFESDCEDTVILSSVREEQLAVLFQGWHTTVMEIWVTTKIEPNAVSWKNLLKVDMKPLTGFRFYRGGSFLIDEERKAVLVIDKDKYLLSATRYTAYIIGENGYYREVDLGEITTGRKSFPLACSYVPSSVQFNQTKKIFGFGPKILSHSSTKLKMSKFAKYSSSSKPS